ncbi:hypothetical protein D3C85_1288970 [compost metagenome]
MLNDRSNRAIPTDAIGQQLVFLGTGDLAKPTALPRCQHNDADGLAHTSSCNGFFCFNSTPFLIATISAMSDKAISAGL